MTSRSNVCFVGEYTAKYRVKHTLTQLCRADQITHSCYQRRQMKTQTHMKTATRLHSSWTIACALLWFTLTSVTCGSPPRSHTAALSAVINSISLTPVDANEAQTSPFLLMVCLCFNKRPFFNHQADQKVCGTQPQLMAFFLCVV